MPSSRPDDITFMRRALRLARRGRWTTTPNPSVGALVVGRGEIVGEGFHRRAGEPHAEILAMEAAGEKCRGATLYCTLEPCTHQGKTPPCTPAVIAAGIKRVVLGATDPNPIVKGRGIEQLRRAGIAVETGLLEEEIRQLNRIFFHFQETGRPRVILKWAATLDGYLADPDGRSRWITGEKARREGHYLRYLVDAILVGDETIIKDDPLLTRRLRRSSPAAPLTRVVLDPLLRVPPGARIFQDQPREGEVIIFTSGNAPSGKALIEKGATLIRLSLNDGLFSIEEILDHLARRGITGLLVEGGGTTLGSFIKQDLADEGYAFTTPGLLGTGRGVVEGVSWPIDSLKRLTPTAVKRLDDDILIRWSR